LHAKQENIAYLLCNIGIISARFSIKWEKRAIFNTLLK